MTAVFPTGPGTQAAAAAEGLSGGDQLSLFATALLASVCPLAAPGEALDHGARHGTAKEGAL